jgi:pseudouridine kinase
MDHLPVASDEARPLLVGGACIDLKGKPLRSLIPCSSNAGILERSSGGVAFNIAANLGKLGTKPRLLTFVGSDCDGRALLEDCCRFGIDTSLVTTLDGEKTASYLAILDERGDLYSAIAAMGIYDRVTPEMIGRHGEAIETAPLVVADANLPGETLQYLISLCKERGARLWVEPTTADKCRRILPDMHGITWLSPNREELEALVGRPLPEEGDLVLAARDLIARGVEHVIVTLGADGVIHITDEEVLNVPSRSVPVKDVTGAGDAFCAGMIWALLKGKPLDESLMFGIAASLLTIQVYESVNPHMSVPLLEWITGGRKDGEKDRRQEGERREPKGDGEQEDRHDGEEG